MKIVVVGSSGVIGHHLTPTVGGPLSPFPSFRVSNARARNELGWKPFYRTV